MSESNGLLSSPVRFDRRSASAAFILIALSIYAIAIALLPSFLALDPEPMFGDPSSWMIALGIFGYILGATALVLAAIKYNWFSGSSTLADVLRGVGKGAILVVVWIGIAGVLELVLVHVSPIGTIGAFALSPLVSGVLVAWWYTTDHWIATNVVGSLIAVLVIVRLGVDVSVGPILLLFGLLAVYDAVAVYVTGHMVTLAKGIPDLEIPLPMLLELPLEDSSGETITDGGEPMAVLGLGDIVIPGVLVVSATVFLPASGVIGIATLPALGAMTGAVAGLLTVFVLFDSGRAHAGLPPLFVGCVGGYLIGAVLAGVPISTALGLEVIA